MTLVTKKDKKELTRQGKINRLRDGVSPSDRMIVLSRIMSNHDSRKWTAGNLVKAALKDEWFKEYMPSYSRATAWADLKKLVAEDDHLRSVVASEYVSVHLDLSDSLIEHATMMMEKNQQVLLKALKEDDYEFASVDPDTGEVVGVRELTYAKKLSLIEKANRTHSNLVSQIVQAMSRQTAVLPMKAPEVIQIEDNTLLGKATSINAMLDLKARLDSLVTTPNTQEIKEERREIEAVTIIEND